MSRRSLREILSSYYLEDLIDDLEKLVEELVERYKPVRIVLTGSLAEGRFVRGLSDIDLLIITRKLETDMDRFTLYSIRDVDVEITVVTEDELREAIEFGKDFYVKALSKGIVVYTAE